MSEVILVIHLILCLALIGTILLQRSEGGALGMGGGGMMTGRGAANFLSRTTAILAVCFIITSISLTVLAKQNYKPSSVIDRLNASGQSKTDDSAKAPSVLDRLQPDAPKPAAPTPAAPSAPSPAAPKAPTPPKPTP